MSKLTAWTIVVVGALQAFGVERGWALAQTAHVGATAGYLSGIATMLVGFLCLAILTRTNGTLERWYERWQFKRALRRQQRIANAGLRRIVTGEEPLMRVKNGTLTAWRAGKLRRIWFRRPYLAVCRHLGDGEFKPPTHLSANLNFCAFGRSITIEGRKEAVKDVCER